MKVFIVFIMMAMANGCDLLAEKYVDASEEVGVREMMLTSRKTKAELLLLGIDSYPSKGKIEYYVLVPSPGFDGPEVLSKALLPQESRLYFTGAQKCVSCFPEKVRLSVKVYGLERKRPIYIDMASIGLLE